MQFYLNGYTPGDPDIQPAATNQGIAGDQREVEEQLDRALLKLVVGDHPSEFDTLIGTEQALQRRPRFTGVDLVAKSARRTERQPEEFQLACRRPGAFVEQLQAPLAHLRVLLVGHQFEAVVQRANRRKQVVAQTGTEQAGEVDGVHGPG